MRPWIATLIAMLALDQAAYAATHTLTIENQTDWEIRSVSVRDGEVSGFQPPCKQTTCLMTVTLPDGVCISRVRVNFTNLKKIERSFADLCDPAPFSISF